ncbi:MAG: acyl-CoA thioesterase, partial [Bacteroidota bacterium]
MGSPIYRTFPLPDMPARLRYLEEVFGYRMDWYDDALVLVRIEIDFVKPVYMYDFIQVLTKVYHLGNKSLTMAQQLAGEKKDDVRCQSTAVLSGFNYKQGEAIPLLNEWRERIRQFEGDVD